MGSNLSITALIARKRSFQRNYPNMAPRLTEAEVAGLLIAFAIMDKSGDGLLSKAEMKEAMKQFYMKEKMSDAEAAETAEAVVSVADFDGDGKINFKEFVHVHVLAQQA